MLNKIILLLLVSNGSVANIRPGGSNRSRPNTVSERNRRSDMAQVIRNMGSQVCPHTDFCYTSASEPIYNETKDPCCNDCSCNDDCWETQRCCPDKEDIVIREQPSSLECKETMTKQGKYQKNSVYDGYNFGIRMYFITDKCPDEITEKQLREKCSGENSTAIEDYRWVSDVQTGKIYQNRNCAICHDVKAWWSWNIQTTCSNILRPYYTNITEVIFSEHCDLINEVPETHAELVARFKCFSPSITSCNQTGLWRRFDRDTKIACQSFTQIYFPREPSRTVYKNVFCYLCNSEENLPTIHLCRKRDNVRKGPYSFSALINIKEIQAEPPDNAECGVDELNDVYLKRCRRLRCPLGGMAFYGQCKQLINGIYGLSVIVVLLLKALPDQTNVSHGWERINTTELGKQVYEEMETALGLMCAICSWEVLMSNNTQALPEFTVHASFRVTPDCQLETIHDKVRATITREQLEMTLNGQKLVMSVDLYTSSLDIIYEELKQTFNIFFDTACPFPLPITTFCPDFELSYSEVASQINGKAQEYFLKLFEDFENVDNGTSLYVCAKDYFMIMSQASTAGNYLSSESLYVLGLVAFKVLCYL